MPARCLMPFALLLACSACSPPVEPPPEKPPEPQATVFRDAIQAPIDKAKAVEDMVQDAAASQRQRIEAAGN